MATDVGHLFMALSAIYIPPLVKGLFIYFVHLLIVCVLLLSFESSSRILDVLYILHTHPLPDTWLENIIFHSVACLSISFICSLTEQKFLILMTSI